MPNSDVVIDLVAKDQKFKGTMTRVQRILQKTAERMKRVSVAAKRMLLVGTGALVGFLRLAQVQEDAVKRLEATLESLGLSTEVWMRQLVQAAQAIQRTTTVGDEMVITYMSMALNLGVTADKLVDATKGGLGLAQALSVDVKTGIRNMTLAMGGNFQMLSRYIPEIRQVTTVTEKFAVVQKIAAAGFKQMEKEALTTAGKIAQLKNTFGDMAEDLGFVFLPILDNMLLKLKAFIPHVETWIKKNGELILSTAKWIAGLTVLSFLLPKITMMVKGLAKAFVLLKASMVFLGGAGSALALLATAVAALAVNLFLMKRAAKEVKEVVDEFGPTFTELNGLQKAFGQTAKDDLEGQAVLLTRIIALREKLVNVDDSRVIDGMDRFRGTLEKQKILLAAINRILAERADKNRTLTPEEDALRKSIEQLTAELKLQVDMYGSSTDAIQLEKLARAGANAEQIETIRLLQEQRAAQKAATEQEKEHTEVSKQAMDRISELRKEILLLTGAVSADKLELIDLRNLGVAKEQLAEIELLMEARRRARKAETDITGKASSAATAQSSIAGRIEGLQSLFSRIQSSAASIQEKITEKNAEDNRKSAAANQQSAGLLGQIAPLVDRITKSVEATSTSGAVFG